MRNTNPRTIIYLAFSSILFIFILFFAWLLLGLNNTIELSKNEKNIGFILNHLNKLYTSITYIERNERPYLMAQSDKYIVEINKTYAIAFNEIGELKKFCNIISFSCKDIQVLDSLINDKYAFSDSIIKLSINGHPDIAIQRLSGTKDSLIFAGFMNQFNKIYNDNWNKFQSAKTEHFTTDKKLFNEIALIIFTISIFLFYAFRKILKQFAIREKLINQNQLFADIINNTADSIVISDMDLNITYCNTATEKLYNRDKTEIIGKFVDDVFETIDTDNVVSPKNKSLREKGYWVGEVVRKDTFGNIFNLYLAINSIKNPDSRITGFFAIATNITPFKKAQQEIEKLAVSLKATNENLAQKVNEQTAIIKEVFERVKDVFIGTDNHLNITYANSNVNILFELNENQICSYNLLGLLFNLTDKENVKLVNDSFGNQQKQSFEFLHPVSKRYFEATVFPSANGISIYFRDITENKLSREEIQQSKRIYEYISKTNDLILHAQHEDEIFTTICQIAVDSGNFLFSWIGIPDEENNILRPFAWAGLEAGYLKAITAISTQNIPEGESPSGNAIREGKLYYCNDIATDPATALWRDEALLRGYRSSIALPVKIEGKVVAIYTMYASMPFYFNENEIQLLSRVTENIGYALQTFKIVSDRIQSENDLRKVTQAIEQSSASVVITDLTGNIEYVNPAFTHLTGYSFEEAVGQNSRILKTGHTTDSEYLNLWKKLTNKKTWHGVFCNKKKNGEKYWEYATISPIVNKEGLITNFVAVKENITERRKLEEEQRELVDIIENTTAFVWRADLNKNLLYLNKAIRKVLEIGEDEDITQLTITEFTFNGELNISEQSADLIMAGKWTGENILKSRSGKKIPVLQVLVIHKNVQGEPTHTSTTAIDLTKIKESEIQLININTELANLARHLQNISEIEKKKISRELHDELGQYLTAMKMSVAWVKKHLDNDKTKLEIKLDEVQEIVTKTISAFKKIHSSLHPAMLEDVGLHAALEWYIRSTEKLGQFTITFTSNMQDQKIDMGITLPLYRVVQECITNSMRYSKATKVVVILLEINSCIYLKIKDNGCGFEVSKVDTKLHHGILGMKERVYAINGEFSISSIIGKGTSVKVKVADVL